MIITRAPYRISFFGGGTDYPEWYREHSGVVLSTTINKYSFLVIRKLPEIFDYKYRIRYYEREEVGTLDQIQIPVIRESIRLMKFTDGVDITHHGDLPNRSGVGSSSSFTVSLMHGLYALRNQQKTKRELALATMHVEQNILKESVGSQDQVAASFGGFNRIEFGGQSEFVCHPLPVKKTTLDQLESWVQLFFTEDLRNSESIAHRTVTNIQHNSALLQEMTALTNEAQAMLFDNNIEEFARLLNTEWAIKQAMEKSITNDKIDSIIARGLSAGAQGAKLLGAGGGGFVLFLTPPELHQQVSRALNLKEVPIKFEYLGSQLIYCDYQDREKHYD
jgi:D-glycero-alpha-D-manno-heptose-7-phosphate kinase